MRFDGQHEGSGTKIMIREEIIMTREEAFERLNKVFREVFDDDAITVGETTTSEDIEDWDSFEHINLVVAVEDECSWGKSSP